MKKIWGDRPAAVSEKRAQGCAAAVITAWRLADLLWPLLIAFVLIAFSVVEKPW